MTGLEVVAVCPDCRGLVVARSQSPGHWQVSMLHRGTCPTRRRARSKRAAERDVIARLRLELPPGAEVSLRHALARAS